MAVILIRTVILYILIMAAFRIMGKRQIGQLQPSELVVAMMISELASIPLERTEISLIAGIIPILTLIIAEITFSFLTLKSRKLRRAISGTPTILIERGKVAEKEMERLRFNIDDLMEELRSNGYPNISDIEYAIIETTGELSVIPKSNKRPITADDLKVNMQYEGMPFLLVSDGKINTAALKDAGITEEWLMIKLREYGVENLSEVFIASLDTAGEFYVQKKAKGDEEK